MSTKAISIRPFIGSKDFEISRKFYSDLGFDEVILSPFLSVFKFEALAFYLQNYYSREWVDNTMIFLEVSNVDEYYERVNSLDLASKYEGVKLSQIKNETWGRECFLHDPSGILWHIGEFVK